MRSDDPSSPRRARCLAFKHWCTEPDGEVCQGPDVGKFKTILEIGTQADCDEYSLDPVAFRDLVC